jgi:predicted alpha/beta-hydrolase family hydrolase
MPSYEFTSLTFQGFGGKPVPNLFLRQAKAATTLAVLYPGLNYTCDMPLLYYPANLLLQHGADVLEVKADYNQPAFQALPGDERLRWAYADASAALQAGRAQRQYNQVVLIGKSIGTLAMAALISAGQVDGAILIWLTPLLHQPVLVQAATGYQGPALFVVGTADSTYDAGELERIRSATQAEAIFVEGGDHRLEVEGELYLSLHRMEEILHGIQEFLLRHGI